MTPPAITILGVIATVLSLGFAALAITKPETIEKYIQIGPTATARIVTQIVEITTTPEIFEVTREVIVTQEIEVTRVIEQQIVVTATPVPSTPTPEVMSDTPSGTVLNVGETWYQGGMEAKISNVNFASNCYNSTVEYDTLVSPKAM